MQRAVDLFGQLRADALYLTKRLYTGSLHTFYTAKMRQQFCRRFGPTPSIPSSDEVTRALPRL